MEDFPDGLRERYEPLRTLGRGGMGSVWAARDRRDGSTVAVKVLAQALAEDDAMRERLRREATVAAGIRHPNLIRILDASLDGPAPALVMELVEGRSLRTFLIAERPLAPERALDLVDALAGALAALHAETIVHRDVKPDNVMVRPDGSPVLLDLGLVRRVDGTALTATGTILGTPAYLAPEVCRGERPGPAADVFALGVLLAELLSPTDLFPYDGPALMRCVTERAAGKAAVPVPATIQGPLRSLVETLTAPGTADRPTDGAAARTAIAAARRELTSGTKPARPTRTTRAARLPAPAPARAQASPRRRLPLVLAAALLLTVLFIAQSRHAEVNPTTSPVSSPAPGEVRKPPAVTDASIAAFKKALDYLAATPSRATLKPLHRAAQDLDPDAARRGIAWYLEGYFPDREVTPATLDRYFRGLALFPLVMDVLHDLDSNDVAGVRPVHVDVATTLWRFACEVNKQGIEFTQTRNSIIGGLLQGTAPEFRAALGRAAGLERAFLAAISDLETQAKANDSPLGAHLRVPELVMRCKTDDQDLIFLDARALADALPPGDDPDARDDLRALIMYVGLDCTAAHEALDAGVRRSDNLFSFLSRWSRDRWMPSCTSVAAERTKTLGRQFLTELGRFDERADETDAFLRTFLPRLSWTFQRQEVTNFLDYLARDGDIPAATHTRLIASARQVEAESPASNAPVSLDDPTFRNRTLTGRLHVQAPDNEAMTLTLVVDDEDVPPTHVQRGTKGPLRFELPLTIPPGWRRVSLDVEWPGQTRLRIWSSIVSLEEPSPAARARALSDALTALAADPSPEALGPVVSAMRSHADPDSSLASLLPLLEAATPLEGEDLPSVTTIQRAIVLLPLIVRVALKVPRPSPSAVLAADLPFVSAVVGCASGTRRAVNRLRIATTRDVIMNRAQVDPSRVDQSRRLEGDLARGLQLSVDSIEDHGTDLAPALRYLDLALQSNIGTRDGVAGDLLALAGTLPSGGPSNVRTLSAMAQSAAVGHLAKLGRLDEAAEHAQALVDRMGIRASFWTLDHCPRDVAAIAGAVCTVVKDALRVGSTIPTALILSYLEHLPWLHQREAFTATISPRDPEVSGTLPEIFRTLQLRAAQTSPAQLYPSTTRVVSLDATGVRLSIGGLASMGLKWRAELLVDGRSVYSALVRGHLDDLNATVSLANSSPVAPGWRHIVVRGVLPGVAGNQPFALADRWIAVLPEEP